MTKPNKTQSDEQAPRRTTIQTIALIYVLLHGFFWTLMSRSFVIQLGPDESPVGLSLIVLASIASVVAGLAMWRWKRWGIYLYAIAAIAVSILAFVNSGGSMLMLFGALLPAIIVAYIFLPAMSSFK